MNYVDLDAIQSVRTYPCVSVLLSTQPAPQLAGTDRERLDTLLDEAERRLRAELDPAHADDLVVRLRGLAFTAARCPAQQALALFVSDDVEWSDRLAVRVRDRVVVDETFATRDLVEHLNRTDPFWLLVLSERTARLFLGNVDSMVELDDGEFPVWARRGSDQADERADDFLRRVAKMLDVELDGDDVPLLLAGVERTMASFTRLSGRTPVGRVLGNHDRTSTRELHTRAWPVMAKVLDARQALALGELDRARGQKRFASGLAEVWSLANDGRVALVVAERSFEVPARLGSSPEHVVPAEDRDHPEVVDDLVDELVEVVLARGGRVVFVDDGVLGEHGRVAAVLRY